MPGDNFSFSISRPLTNQWMLRVPVLPEQKNTHFSDFRLNSWETQTHVALHLFLFLFLFLFLERSRRPLSFIVVWHADHAADDQTINIKVLAEDRNCSFDALFTISLGSVIDPPTCQNPSHFFLISAIRCCIVIRRLVNGVERLFFAMAVMACCAWSWCRRRVVKTYVFF